MNATDFLTALWGPTPAGLIHLWQLADKRSFYVRSPEAATAFDGKSDVYCGVALAHQDHGPHRRTRNDQALGIPGLWLDIDINGGPENKTGAAGDVVKATALAHALLEPTVIVNSGYGLHAWWLLDDPWIFASKDEQQQAALVAARWQQAHRERAGYAVDATHDLARLLRLPGTKNAKGGQSKPVTVVQSDGPRYDFATIAQAVQHIAITAPAETDLPEVVVGSPTDDTLIRDLIANSPMFAKTWRHDRPDRRTWSMSEYDLALCVIAARTGRTDQQLADLISAHRSAHGSLKGLREDYVARTIRKARTVVETPEEPDPNTSGNNGTLSAEAWADVIVAGLQSTDDDCIPLPWPRLNDDLDGGIFPGEVCLVGGFTSHGKSLVVDQIADHAAGEGRSVHLYMTEMTAYRRGLRLLARRTGISFRTLKRRELTPDHWDLVMRELNLLNYGCSIVSDWSIDQVVSHIRANRWDMAIIDLIHGFAYRDAAELSATSSALVRAAKGAEHQTAIVAAAHLNDQQMRDARSPARPRPGMHSLKGSTSLKQDADLVMFVWRQDTDDGIPSQNGELWFAKSRDSGFGGIRVQLNPARMIFEEADWNDEDDTVWHGRAA